MISCLRPQELRSGWNSAAFHTRRMMVGEELSASIDSKSGTGIRPGSPLPAATETPLSEARRTTAKMSCSDCVLLITKLRMAFGECVFFNSAMARRSQAEAELLQPTPFPQTPRQRALGTVCGRAGECRAYADGSRKFELCAREAKPVPLVAGP